MTCLTCQHTMVRETQSTYECCKIQIIHVGTQSYLHEIGPAKWVYAYSNECRKPRKVYSREFYNQCARLCRDVLNLNLQSDLTSQNCFYVYVFLINSIS